MIKKLMSIGVVLLVLALLVTLAPACGKEKGEVKTLKIGHMNPLSGPVAPWGTAFDRGVRWAADVINADGGIKVGDDRYMVEIVSWDTKYMGSEAAIGAAKFVYDEGIHYVIGPVGGHTAPAVDPTFAENKCLYVTTGSVSHPSPDLPYRINGCTETRAWIDAWLSQCHTFHPEVQTLAIITPHSVTGEEYENAIEEIGSRYGLTIVASESFELGTTDFYPILTGIVAKNPDAIEFGGVSAGDTCMLTKQVRELGYTGLLYQECVTMTSLLIEVAGAENVWGICSNEPDWTAEAYPKRTRDLYQEWLEKYSKPGEYGMDRCVTIGYSALLFYRDAMEQADSIDPDEVMKVIDDPGFRFDIFAADNVRLGGLETFGVRRQFPLSCDYGEIIDAEHVNLSMSMIMADVP